MDCCGGEGGTHGFWFLGSTMIFAAPKAGVLFSFGTGALEESTGGLIILTLGESGSISCGLHCWAEVWLLLSDSAQRIRLEGKLANTSNGDTLVGADSHLLMYDCASLGGSGSVRSGTDSNVVDT